MPNPNLPAIVPLVALAAALHRHGVLSLDDVTAELKTMEMSPGASAEIVAAARESGEMFKKVAAMLGRPTP